MKIIGASAGSGKTYRLAYEYVRGVVADPTLYRHILAVTFTNKATEEMRGRILLRLHELAAGKPSLYLDDLLRDLELTEMQIRKRAKEAQTRILHDYSRFAVLTIDRFFQRLIRAFIRELGIEVNFNIELETDTMLARAVDALIDESDEDEKLQRRLHSAMSERLAQGKRWNVKESLLELGKELFGERWHRAGENASELIEEVITASRVVKERYAAKAREILSGIGARGLGVNDFRGKSKGLVPWLERAANGEFATMNSYVSAELGAVEGLNELAAIYEANFRLVNSAALLRENRHDFLLLTDLRKRIEHICREQNIMPIAETNRVIAQLVSGNDTPFIFEKAGTYFSHFFIDEFQDTSTAQWENFVPLLQNSIAQQEGDPVMLIGDVKQAIYRWRGGDWQILSYRVSEEMGAGRVEVETLEVNHRSLKNVVDFNNRAISLLVEAGNRQLNEMVTEGLARGDISRETAAELTDVLKEAYTDHTQTPRSQRDEGYVTLSAYDEDPPVVEKVEELLSRGFAKREIAVLVRTNNQAARVASMLLTKGHQVVTQEALAVGGSAVSRFIIAVLSLAIDPADSIQRAIYNHWLGRAFDAHLDDPEFFARLAAMSPEQAFEETVLRFGLSSRSCDIAYIQAVHQQITTFTARQVADIALFLKWWDERGQRASIAMQDGADAVTVSTIHKSKGLQYGAVIVPWLSWPLGVETRGRNLVVWADGVSEELGTVPVNFKKEMVGSHFAAGYYRESVMASVDAMNLFYVAVTRAEKELHLMTSTAKSVLKNAVGNLLRGVLGDEVKFGEATNASVREVSAVLPTFNFYPTSRPETKVRMRISQERQTGVSMHSLMEQARSFDDVCRVLGRVPADPRIRDWFDHRNWDSVRSESAIILPGGAQTRRPDRVMIRDKRAVVIDYKFGRVERSEYSAQLREYADLLTQMGYTTEAHVWYASLDKVVDL